MSYDEIRKRLDDIRAMAGDDEAAHGTEDKLHHDFINYVASDPNDDDLGEKAKLVLSTYEIKFERWCA